MVKTLLKNNLSKAELFNQRTKIENDALEWMEKRLPNSLRVLKKSQEI